MKMQSLCEKRDGSLFLARRRNTDLLGSHGRHSWMIGPGNAEWMLPRTQARVHGADDLGQVDLSASGSPKEPVSPELLLTKGDVQ